MKKMILLVIGLAMSGAVVANPHKCEVSGKTIFQDAPCNGEVQASTDSEPEQRELFDKVFIDQLKVSKSKERGDYTPVLFEVIAINNTKNRVQIILKYDGLDSEGLAIDTTTLVGNIDNNSKAVIKSGLLGSNKKTALLKRIVKWRFNSWKSSIN